MENAKAKKVSSVFGGMLGTATDSLKSRKDKIEEETNKATETPAPSKQEERPPMSKKWYER